MRTTKKNGRSEERPLISKAVRYGFGLGGVVVAGLVAGATEPAGFGEVPAGAPVGLAVGAAPPAGFGGAGTPDSVL